MPDRDSSSYFTKGRVFAFGAMLVMAACTVRAAENSSGQGTQDLIAAGRFKDAITILLKVIDEQPADESSRILLAEAFEKDGQKDEALDTLHQLLKLSSSQAVLHEARKSIARISRQRLDESDIARLEVKDKLTDHFHIPMPEIDWKGLEIVEDSKYLPSPIPAEHPFDVPPFVYETEHFTVYSCNERLSKIVGERAEVYLRFMIERLFAGRAWAVRFPIFVYRDHQDYASHGAPGQSVGVTKQHVTGKTNLVMIFQLGYDNKGQSTGRVSKDQIESTLPHELTHAVLNEFFGAQEIPRWLHEAVAGRFEQARDHYYEAARLARFVNAGEYFRMRDLFEHKGGYPERVQLFYEQAAIVVLYLFETGPEAMNAFLTELAAGHDHDAACAAALGIPEEEAVEEFEKRWVEWMKVRYLKNLDRDKDLTVKSDAGVSSHRLFSPWVNELDTVSSISDWRTVDLGTMDAFTGVGQSKSDWSTSGGVLKCEADKRGGSSILGIRMNEVAPVAISFDVRCTDNSAGRNVFGLTQLDANGQDTRIEVSAKLPDTSTHAVVALWSDDLAVYVDGVCTGRYPAYQVRGNEQEVNFPLAFVAYGPVEVQNIKVASIKKFSDKPLVASAEDEKKGDDQGGGRRRRGESRRHGVPSSGPGG